MLLQLNEYCIYAICEYLDLTDHLRLSRVCKDLQQLIANKFQRNSNAETLQTICWNKEKQEFQLPKFVLNLMENTKDHITCDTDELYEVRSSLENLEFDAITTLELTVEKIQPEQAAELENLLTNLFPCVLKLILRQNFVRTRYFYLVTIEEIEVCCTPEDGIWDLIQICDLKKISFQKPLKDKKDFKRLTRCTELEELTLSRAAYDDLVADIGFRHIMDLAQLTLTDAFYAENAENALSLNEQHFHRLIDSVCFHLTPTSSRHTQLEGITINANLSKLRRLTLVNDNGTVLKAFCQHNSKRWCTLEEIYYLKDTDDKMANEQQEYLLYIACLCPKLRVLDISGSAIDDQFVESLAKFLTLQTRKQKLLLRCHNTKIKKQLKHPNIIVTFEKFYHFLPEENEIQIELKDERRTPDLMHYLRDLLETYKENNSELAECLEILNVVEQDFNGIEQSLLDFENNTHQAEISATLSAAQMLTQEKLQLVRSELLRSTKTILERFWIDYTDEELDNV